MTKYFLMIYGIELGRGRGKEAVGRGGDMYGDIRIGRGGLSRGGKGGV